MLAEGQRVDNFLACQPQPAAKTVFESLRLNFDYLECQGCGHILETAKLTPEIVETWRFELMGLRPSILSIAKATCPVCQKLFKQFGKVLRGLL